ncbi:glycine zipper 2TM domain-containing protein [Prochlorococcus sp. MIT 1300]|uniref:glycine zipper 2TM domain-containing protein n=1 Tax=Prochlorococcus sp. MIT 1300 TaxID=3096218 RepID=UPI002A74B505|nr:glycine zipper 2TM domain-containing protein [Prochlorococcus sp. MIT 1300]
MKKAFLVLASCLATLTATGIGGGIYLSNSQAKSNNLNFTQAKQKLISENYQPGYSTSQTCSRNEYREEYVPGTRNSPGYVKAWNETIEFPCNQSNQSRANQPRQVNTDTNDCKEGTIIGGLLGGGLATKGSRGKDRWWAIPAGAVAGAMLGCQIDGG